MYKIAQRRSFLNKVRESVNFSGKIFESFSDRFQELMDQLRASDNAAREIALGKGDTDGRNLKEIIKAARKSYNGSDYVGSAAELNIFHDNLIKIITNFKNVRDLAQVEHDKFLKETIVNDNDKIQNLKKKFEITPAAPLSSSKSAMFETKVEILKMAGLFSYFSKKNISTRFWDKTYPKQMAKLKTDTSNLLDKSNKLLEDLKETFSELAEHRAKRKIESYVTQVNKFINKYDRYDADFKKYYNDNIKDFLARITAADVEKLNKNPDVAPSIAIKPPVVPAKAKSLSIEQNPIDLSEHSEEKPFVEQDTVLTSTHLPASPSAASTRAEFYPLNPNSKAPALPIKTPMELSKEESVKDTEKSPSPLFDEEAIDTDKMPVVPPTIRSAAMKKSYVSFIKSLDSFANEHESITASYILKHAKIFAKESPEVANHLISIAKQLIG